MAVKAEKSAQTGREDAAKPRVLMLIPSYAKNDVQEKVAANQHPTMDYFALQSRLGADIADYSVLDADRNPMVRAARKAGRDAALAMHGFLKRKEYDVIFSNGENVSIPLASLFKSVRKRPGHVLIGHHLSPSKKKPFLRSLHPQMDAIFLYAATQKAYAIETLGIPEHKLHLIPFHADAQFYQPMPDVTVENCVSSAGLEWRDYPTLIEAVAELDLEVRLAAASPWSKHKNETENRELPRNVTARRYAYDELRELYAKSRFVVVPLYDNDFQAGVTTLLEAMSMGKAVIITQTKGQRDVIQHGVNGLYVPPGDVQAFRSAIVSLLACPEKAAEMGANARRTIETEMSLDLWADRIAQVTREVAAGNVR